MIAERCGYVVAEIAKTAPGRPFSLLDVGCGSGMLLPHLVERFGGNLQRYVGVDHDDPPRLEKRYRSIATPHEFQKIDLDSDWDVGRFDFVVCLEVIEHLKDDKSLFRKLSRAVAPGGHLILTTPSLPFVARMGRHIPSFDDISAMQDGGHVRMGYTRETLAAMARENDLDIVTKSCLSSFDAPTLARYLRYNSTLGYCVYNLLHNRRSAGQQSTDDDGSVAQAENFWSFGIVCRKRSGP
jgi:2-polyprenyl-3-methyl-5-hydroxy-6-metoxy-1,4-benzoquinol methylase